MLAFVQIPWHGVLVVPARTLLSPLSNFVPWSLPLFSWPALCLHSQHFPHAIFNVSNPFKKSHYPELVWGTSSKVLATCIFPLLSVPNCHGHLWQTLYLFTIPDHGSLDPICAELLCAPCLCEACLKGFTSLSLSLSPSLVFWQYVSLPLPLCCALAVCVSPPSLPPPPSISLSLWLSDFLTL